MPTRRLYSASFFLRCLFAVSVLYQSVIMPLAGQSNDKLDLSATGVDSLLLKARHTPNDAEKETLAYQILQIARDLRYESATLQALVLLGEINLRNGRTEVALQYYIEAEAKAGNIGNKQMMRNVSVALGDLFFQEKLYGIASRYYARAMELAPENFDIQEKMADACLYDMRFDSAESYYKNLIVKYKNEGNNARLVKIFQKLAGAYGQQGETGKSIYYYTAIEHIIEAYGTAQEKSLLYSNLGRQYVRDFNYEVALRYFRKAELQCIYIPCDYPEVMYANLGVALHNTGNTQRGIEYLTHARDILLRRKDWAALASLENLIAGVYHSRGDLNSALKHNEIAIVYARETQQPQVLADAYEAAANIYQDLYDFERAFESYRNYLNQLDVIRFEEQRRQQRLEQQRSFLIAAEGQYKYLIARQNLNDLELQQSRYEQERLQLLNANLSLDAQRKKDEVLLLQKQKEVDGATLREKTFQALQAQQELRLAAQRLDVEKQNSLIAELRRQEESERAKRLTDSTSRAREVERIQREQEYQMAQEANFRRLTYGAGIFITTLGILGTGWFFSRRASRRLASKNREIEAQKNQIEQERHKSDRLLLNILPEEIAAELKAAGQANPRYYESATVLFTDFANFTRLSSQLAPRQLIDELNECFLAFDEICEKNGLEKIKTIGDAFMCAGGLPVTNFTHPEDAVQAALEMTGWLERRNHRNPHAVFREMRIGIHTGPVVAGVVGKNKFAYDIWGDAVNLAARLEEYGEPGRVNISKVTYEAVSHRYRCVHRGKKRVHNKGWVDMYFVETERDEA